MFLISPGQPNDASITTGRFVVLLKSCWLNSCKNIPCFRCRIEITESHNVFDAELLLTEEGLSQFFLEMHKIGLTAKYSVADEDWKKIIDEIHNELAGHLLEIEIFETENQKKLHFLSSETNLQ